MYGNVFSSEIDSSGIPCKVMENQIRLLCGEIDTRSCCKSTALEVCNSLGGGVGVGSKTLLCLSPTCAERMSNDTQIITERLPPYVHVTDT